MSGTPGNPKAPYDATGADSSAPVLVYYPGQAKPHLASPQDQVHEDGRTNTQPAPEAAPVLSGIQIREGPTIGYPLIHSIIAGGDVNDANLLILMKGRRLANTVRFLAIIDVLIGVFWLFSAAWWMGMSLLYGLVGYWGAASFSRITTGVYIFLKVSFGVAFRTVALILAMSGNFVLLPSSTSSMSPFISGLSVFLELLLVGYVVTFWKQIPTIMNALQALRGQQGSNIV